MAFPITAGISLATTIGGGIFGAIGQAEQNSKNKKASKKQNKYNKKVWRFNNDEQDRIYDFKVEEQEITKRNYEADIKFQEDSRQQQWDYQMGIRDYQFSQETRAYDESVARAGRQKSFNQMAEDQALLEQQRYLQENLVNLAFTESQTMMDFAAATAGFELKRGQAKGQAALTKGQAAGQAQLSKQRIQAETTLGIKQKRTETQLARQQATIESLKARGQAMAAGQAGRSARKVAQGIRAEAGAQQASLVEQFLLAEEGALQKQLFDVQSIEQQLLFTQQNVVQQLLFTEQGIDLNLTKLNGQLEFDKLQMKATRDNLSAADALSKKRIALERKQADIEAEASIRLKPEIAPPLPKPMALPRKEWGEIFRPNKAPKPKKVQPQVTNPYLTLGQSVLSGIGDLASAGAFDNMFTPGPSGYTPFPVFGSGGGLGITDTSVFNMNINPINLKP